MILLTLGFVLLLGGLSSWVVARQVRRDVEHLDTSTSESVAAIVSPTAKGYRDAPEHLPPFERRPVRLCGRVVGGSEGTVRTLDGRPAVFVHRMVKTGKYHAKHEVQREDFFWLNDASSDHRACIKLPRTSKLPTAFGVAQMPGAARSQPIIYLRSTSFVHGSATSFGYALSGHRMTQSQVSWALKLLRRSDASYLFASEMAVAVGDEVAVSGVATWDGEQLVVEGGEGNDHPLRLANLPFEEVSRFAKTSRGSEVAMIVGAALIVAWLAATALGIPLS